ncbi:hypothetical protein KAU32_09985 [bacterium]|nr:hypothetical protein [bacterium]
MKKGILRGILIVAGTAFTCSKQKKAASNKFGFYKVDGKKSLTIASGKRLEDPNDRLTDNEIEAVIIERTRMIEEKHSTKIYIDWRERHTEFLVKEGDRIIPFLEPLLSSSNQYHKAYAMDLLLRINSDESMTAAYDKINGFYNNEHHWLLDYIIRIFLENDEKDLYISSICEKIVTRNDSKLSVLATRYLWKNHGAKYMDRFLRFSTMDTTDEIFIAFLNELLHIVDIDGTDKYDGFIDFRIKFRERAIKLSEEESPSWEAIYPIMLYLSTVEEKWFASNWVKLYKNSASDRSGNDKKVAVRRGVVRNDMAYSRIEELKTLVSNEQYENIIYFLDKERKILLQSRKTGDDSSQN